MAYTVATKLGSAYQESFSIADGIVNTTATAIPILGSSAPPGYAQSLAKSLVTILSNGASAIIDRPTNALIGQEWFDFTNKTMTVYTGASTGWKNIFTDGSTNLMVTPNQGGLGLVPTSASAGYVVRVNSTGSGYELTPGAFVRTDASSAPLTDNTLSIGSTTAKYKEIFASTFNGNSTSSNKLYTPRSINLVGDIEGTVVFDGSSNVSIPTKLVGGQLSAYLQRTGDTMNVNCPIVGGIGPGGGFLFPANSYGGSGDISGIQMGQRSGEDTVLAIFNKNDPTDSIQFNTGFYEFYNLSADGINTKLSMVITNAGKVGIGTASPTTELEVMGGVKSTTMVSGTSSITSLFFGNGTGTNLTVDGNVVIKTRLDTPTANIGTISTTSLTSSNTALSGSTKVDGNMLVTGIITAGDVSVGASDKKIKTNIQPIQDALSMIKKLAGYEYDFDIDQCNKVGFSPTRMHEHGLIAQEVIDVLPDAMIDNGNYLNYRERPVLALVVSAINELNMKLDEIKQSLGI